VSVGVRFGQGVSVGRRPAVKGAAEVSRVVHAEVVGRRVGAVSGLGPRQGVQPVGQVLGSAGQIGMVTVDAFVDRSRSRLGLPTRRRCRFVGPIGVPCFGVVLGSLCPYPDLKMTL